MVPALANLQLSTTSVLLHHNINLKCHQLTVFLEKIILIPNILFLVNSTEDLGVKQLWFLSLLPPLLKEENQFYSCYHRKS